MPKVLVLGSNSFSGSHFVAHCLEKGADVVGLSRSPELDPVFLAHRWRDSSRFRFVQLDINGDLQRLGALLDEFRPDFVVNFIAQGMVAQSWQQPLDWYRTNLVAMVGVHELVRHRPWIQKFVQASTPEVYGNTPDWVQENCPLNPTTPYAISKAACDLNLLAYVKAYEFPAVLTRSANVCGPGQQLYRILPRTFFCAYTGEKMQLDGGGTSQRCFIHIQDVCAATWLAMTAAPAGSIYHLSTRELTSIRELVQRAMDCAGADFSELVEVGAPRLGQDAGYLLDSSRAHEELGWSPRFGLPEILEQTRDWVRDNLPALKQQPRSYVHKA